MEEKVDMNQLFSFGLLCKYSSRDNQIVNPKDSEAFSVLSRAAAQNMFYFQSVLAAGILSAGAFSFKSFPLTSRLFGAAVLVSSSVWVNYQFSHLYNASLINEMQSIYNSNKEVFLKPEAQELLRKLRT